MEAKNDGFQVRNLLFQGLLFSFHVKFQGCIRRMQKIPLKNFKKGFPPQKDESMVDLPMKSTHQNQKMARIELPRWVSLE